MLYDWSFNVCNCSKLLPALYLVFVCCFLFLCYHVWWIKDWYVLLLTSCSKRFSFCLTVLRQSFLGLGLTACSLFRQPHSVSSTRSWWSTPNRTRRSDHPTHQVQAIVCQERVRPSLHLHRRLRAKLQRVSTLQKPPKPRRPSLTICCSCRSDQKQRSSFKGFVLCVTVMNFWVKYCSGECHSPLFPTYFFLCNSVKTNGSIMQATPHFPRR